MKGIYLELKTNNNEMLFMLVEYIKISNTELIYFDFSGQRYSINLENLIYLVINDDQILPKGN